MEKKADYFARFYLTKFRPEVTCYDTNQPNEYGYHWEDLEEWIETCQKFQGS